MTVSTEDISKSYKPGAAMAPEAVGFQFLDSADLIVVHVAAATGVETTLVSGTDYAIAGDGMANTGTITALAAWPTDDDFVITRVTPGLQKAVIPAHEAVPALALERQLDRQALVGQENRDAIGALDDRAIKMPAGETAGTLPKVSQRASRIFGFGVGGVVSLLSYTSVAGLIAPFLPAALKGDKGDPGGSVGGSVGPRTGVSAVTIPAGTKRFHTDGGAAALDGGRAPFLEDSEQTTLTAAGTALVAASEGRGTVHATAQASAVAMEARFRVADLTARRFRLDGPQTHLAFKAAGDTPRMTIQAMIDAANYWHQELGRIAPGDYSIDGAIYATRGEVSGAYQQIELRGSGRKFYGNVGNGTVLRFTDKTRAGIIFQAYRHSKLLDMTLMGAAYDAAAAVFLGSYEPRDGGGALIDDYDVATWYSTYGLSPRRYAPHGAVVLDPRAGAAPGGGAGTLTAPFPADANPDWMGATTAHDLSVGSSFDTNVEILGWEVGVVDPPTVNDQGDYTGLDKISIAHCIYGVAAGRSQGRNLTGYELNIALVHTAMTNRVFGPKGGKFGGTITLSGGASIQLFDFDAASLGGITIQDSYTEAQFKLGDVVCGTYSNGAIRFEGGSFELTGGNVRRGMVPYHLGDPTAPGGGINTYVPISVYKTFFGVPDVLALLANDLTFDGQILSRTMLSNMIDPASPELDASGFDKKIADAAERRARRMAHNGTLGLITPKFVVSAEHRISGALFDLDTPPNAQQVTTGRKPYTMTGRKYGIPHWERTVFFPGGGDDINPAYALEMPQLRGTIDKSAIVGLARVTTGKGTRWTGTLPAGYRGANAHVAAANNIGPGRVCYDDEKGTAFWVPSYDFTTGAIVLEQFYNFHIPAGETAAQPRLAISTSAGTLYFIETSFFTPIYPMLGDVDTSSDTITNLRRASDGDDSWLTVGTPSLPEIGDWLFFNPGLPDASQPFTGAKSRVVGKDYAAGTIQMSGVANFTGTGVPFYLWRRGS